MQSEKIYVLFCIKLEGCPPCNAFTKLQDKVQNMLNKNENNIIMVNYIVKGKKDKRKNSKLIDNIVMFFPCLVLCKLEDLEYAISNNTILDVPISILSYNAKNNNGKYFVDTDTKKIMDTKELEIWINESIKKI